jgi:ribosomal protein S18 acetylase RimI-like enzyme
MNIRPALVADAGAIAAVHVRSWQAAYAQILSADYLASLSVAERARRWAEILQASESATLVAMAEGSVLGFVSFAHSRDQAAPPKRAEIWSLYASPEAWDHGVGRGLLASALASLQAQGFSETSLWVLSGNARAIRFYGAAGFKAVPGSQRLFTLGGTAVEETQFLLEHADSAANQP